MKIDTLFLSACGSKISGYVGVFRALLETKIIELDKIKRYVCCSSGAIIGFNICCGLSLPIMQNLSFKINYLELYDLNDLDDLFENHGLFSNKRIGDIISSILYTIYKTRNMTLLEFYKKTNKHFICKVFNLSKKQDEYFCYKTHPDLSIITLIQMTTCIPIMFKPIVYKKEYFIDGGISGLMPFIDKYKDYIGIYICNKCNRDIEKMDAIEYIIQILTSNSTVKFKNNRIINISEFNESVCDFDLTNKRKSEIINKSYEVAIDHINKYFK